jgi:hypothetical protein
MEIFTVKMPALFDAMLGDPRLLSTAGKLADARPHSQQGGGQLSMLSETSRRFCAVLAAHLAEARLDALQVRQPDAGSCIGACWCLLAATTCDCCISCLICRASTLCVEVSPSGHHPVLPGVDGINPHTDTGVQDPESPAAVLVLRLFAIVFEVMAKYNVKTDDILLPVFPRLIARTQELAAAAKNPSGAMGPCIPSVKLKADVSAARICAAGYGGQPDHYSASHGLK